MSTIDVPTRFEDYLPHIGAKPISGDARCEGCGRHPAVYELAGGAGPTPYCAACLGNFHGDDLAELRMLRALIGGAVRSALEANVSAKLIRDVVDETLDEDREREAYSFGYNSGRADARRTEGR